MNQSKESIVRIDRPFRLSNGTRTYPAGDYEVTTENEQLGDFTFEAFRRISTRIYLPPVSGQMGIGEILEIDPVELENLVLQSEPLNAGQNLAGP
jgi:hypothetical protein